MEITGTDGIPSGGSLYDGAFYRTTSTYEALTTNTGSFGGVIYFKASRSWTGSTSVEGSKFAHSLNVSCKNWKRIC